MNKNISLSLIGLCFGALMLQAMPLVASAAVPSTTAVSPNVVTVGGSSFTLTVNGTNFTPSSRIYVNSIVRATTFVSSTQLIATISAIDIASIGSLSVVVINPEQGGGTSNTQTVTVAGATQNPIPSIASISPSIKTRGEADFVLTVTGANFAQSSVVRFNGVIRPTVFVSSSQLTATIPAADIATAGNYPITIFSPAPGGGASSAVTFNVLFVQGQTPTPPAPQVTPPAPALPNTGFGPSKSGNSLVMMALMFFFGAAVVFIAEQKRKESRK